MVDIIHLHGDPHEKMHKLLPWYVTGQLDADETATFETHLADCAECRKELRSDRLLASQIASQAIGEEIDVERGWAGLRENIEAQRHDSASDRMAVAPRRWPRRPTTKWVLRAQAAAILVLGIVIAVPKPEGAPQYQALGSQPVSSTGNMIVVFRPETPERELRRALNESGARLVDGPTSSDAYVLRVADARRDAALAKLRTLGDVMLAEPIDAGRRP